MPGLSATGLDGSRPALGVLGPGLLVEGVGAGKDLAVLAAVAMIGGDEVQGAVAVGVVTPGDEATNSGIGPARGARKATRVGGDP